MTASLGISAASTSRRRGQAGKCLAFVLLVGWSCLPAAALSEVDLRSTLAGYLVHPALRGATTACLVRELPPGRDLLSVRADRPLIPASLVKLLVSATAVELFGPDFVFATSLWSESPLQLEGTLPGDLYLEGCADPLAGTAVFAKLARDLRDAGLKVVAGDLVAGVPILVDDGDRGLRGAQRLHDALGALGLKVVGQPREDLGTQAPVLLARRTSLSLADYLRRINKQSRNREASRLLSSLLACFDDPRAPDPDFVIGYWAQQGLETEGMHLADGSGYSRSNHLSAELLVGVLEHLAAEPQAYRVLSRSLPVAGREGTLASRMRDTAAQGRVRAKTGTLPKISCLSGYVEEEGQARIAFSILMNDFACSLATARRIQDQMAIALAQYVIGASSQEPAGPSLTPATPQEG